MSNYQIKGSIHFIGETTSVSDKFKKREIVICDNSEKFAQYLSFQFVQDKCNLLDGLNLGEDITINFNLKGREWTGKDGQVKYFNSLEGWKISNNENTVSSSKEDTSINDMPF